MSITIKHNHLSYRTIKLSDRELEVLFLIAHEYKNREIADMLYISEHTVDSHRKNLLNKLIAKNTAGLVRKAFEFRIFPMTMPQFVNGLPQALKENGIPLAASA